MSQGFRLKYDDIPENSSSKTEEENLLNAYDASYKQESHARNICFVWQDGKRIFLAYSYLVAGEYLPEESSITLTFTSHKFRLKGVNLEGLFYDIMQQVAMQIVCTDARYNLIGEDEKFVVNEIELVSSAKK